MAKASRLDTTRRNLLSAGLPAVLLPAALANAAAVGPDSMIRLAPTEIGREMLRLLPAHAEATWHGCYCEFRDPDEAVIECWERRTWTPIMELAEKATNIVDLAIGHRIWRGTDAMFEDDELEVVIVDRLTAAVLAAAGIPAAACRQGPIWEKNGWGLGRGPTLDERHEALARQAIPDAEIEAYCLERADLSRLIQES
jgi:hypothetical protein